jgi:hypothetical protein
LWISFPKALSLSGSKVAATFTALRATARLSPSHQVPKLAKYRPQNGEHEMPRVLFVGQEPETVDFSDPALPPGFSAEKIHAGIAVAMRQMTERGWQADLCLVAPDETAAPAVEHQLADKLYDGVVIGGGIRLPPKSLLLFEAVINAVHRAAPGAFIAFNTRPEDSADAAARWLRGH